MFYYVGNLSFYTRTGSDLMPGAFTRFKFSLFPAFDGVQVTLTKKYYEFCGSCVLFRKYQLNEFFYFFQEITSTGSIEHAVHVFKWMKNQKNYCANKDIYVMMIRLHARHNHVDQARGLFFEMQEWRYGYQILELSFVL